MKPRYSFDRKAPRMRKAKFTKAVITRELWKKFIKEFPEYEKLSWDEFYSGWDKLASIFRKKIIENPLGVKLGSYLGELKLQYLPYKFKGVDHNTSEKLGEQTDFLKIETRGKVAKLKWERRWAVKFNKILQYYAFTEDRKLSIAAKNYITSNPDKLRMSRNTLGGVSIWRQRFNKK